MLGCLKAIDGHASKNILKKHHYMMDGVPIPRPTTHIFSSFELEGSTSIPNESLESKLPINDGGEWYDDQGKHVAEPIQEYGNNGILSCFHF
jgi:hypothetical protein